jgi:hypothetical protein
VSRGHYLAFPLINDDYKFIHSESFVSFIHHRLALTLKPIFFVIIDVIILDILFNRVLIPVLFMVFIINRHESDNDMSLLA